MMPATLLATLLLLQPTAAAWKDWERAGAVADGRDAAPNNTLLLNQMLADLHYGDTLFISNKTFWVAGGVHASGLNGTTLWIDGTLKFLPGRKGWPTTTHCNWVPLQPTHLTACVQEAIFIANSTGITFTSNGTGTIDGSGASWWGFINYALHGENRPRLMAIYNSVDVLIENALQSAHAKRVAKPSATP